jgi:hypothetical protein
VPVLPLLPELVMGTTRVVGTMGRMRRGWAWWGEWPLPPPPATTRDCMELGTDGTTTAEDGIVDSGGEAREAEVVATEEAASKLESTGREDEADAPASAAVAAAARAAATAALMDAGPYPTTPSSLCRCSTSRCMANPICLRMLRSLATAAAAFARAVRATTGCGERRGTGGLAAPAEGSWNNTSAVGRVSERAGAGAGSSEGGTEGEGTERGEGLLGEGRMDGGGDVGAAGG